MKCKGTYKGKHKVEIRCIVAVYIEKLNLANIVINRPPDTESGEFEKIMNKTKKLLLEMEINEPTVIITGDFNFPFVAWKRGRTNACDWKNKKKIMGEKMTKSNFIH